MANAQLVFDRNPSIAPNSFLRFNIIDNGDGTCSVYVEERANSDALSKASAIPSTGLLIAGMPSGGVTGNGTTDAITKWTNGPGSVLGNSSLFDNGTVVGFGGLTSSFPALKRSNATLQVRLADDSTFGNFNSASITVLAGNVTLDNNQAFRIKDNAANNISVIQITSANNLQFNGSAVGGNMNFQLPNATGTMRFLLNSVLGVAISQTGDVTIGAGIPISGTNAINLFASSEATKPVIRFLSTGAGTGKWQYSNDGISFTDFGNGNYASRALSNLAAVAVNLALSPGADNSISLNDVTHRYIDVFLSGQVKWTDGAGNADAGLSRKAANLIGVTNGGAGFGALGFDNAAIRQSATTGSTLAVVATGDLDTGRSLAMAMVRFIAADSSGANSSLSELAAKVVQAGDGNQNANGWLVDAGVKRVSVQFDKNDTTLANITGLSVNVQAGRTYSFEATLFTSSNVGGGVKVAIGGTTTATAIIYEGLSINAGAQTQSRATALGSAVGAVTAVTGALIKIYGTITVNAAGTLTVQFAENAAVGTSSVLVGSYFRVWDNP